VATHAQENYPNRPIHVLTTSSAGGISDIFMRVLGEELHKSLGQPIIIENRPGGGGTVGIAQAARATPDGYTILFHSASFSSAYVTYKTLPYDTLNDFTAVSPVSISPNVLVAAPSKGFKTVADLIAAAKARPGSLNYASAGIGSASHLGAEKFRIAAGIVAQHIPFKGPVEALIEVMAGRVDYNFLPIVPALPFIKDGKLVALLVSSAKRAYVLPDVPTAAESGLAGATYEFWNGVFAPAKIPRDIVDRLYHETQKAIADAGVKERLATLGIAPLVMTQPQFAEFFRGDVLETVKLAEAAHIEKQ
jgi:tripartite-type tricarboxylate transporter receptor subunit TctC